jgi:Lysozyme like domain
MDTGIRLALLAVTGLVLMLIGLTGKLGSVLGAVLDPGAMTGGATVGGTQLPTAGTLSLYQIGKYAYANGFLTGLDTAIAVAMAESSGQVGATHTNADGSIDRGLWQINSVHAEYDASRLLSDPGYNAQAAYAISGGGTNWNPWTTYRSGAYRQFLHDANAVAEQIYQGG